MTGDEPLIVVDCSVIVDALVMAELGDLRRDLSGLTLFAPALLDYEVVSALRCLTLGQRLSSHRATAALGDYLDLPIVRTRQGRRQDRYCATTGLPGSGNWIEPATATHSGLSRRSCDIRRIPR